MDAMTVGACRERFHPVPPGKSGCREPMRSALRMLLVPNLNQSSIPQNRDENRPLDIHRLSFFSAKVYTN
jgi:hypothetical protein